MKRLALFIYLLSLPVFASGGGDQKPIKVYCFSADIEAGFTDERGEEMCRALAKRGKKKKSLILTGVDDANIVVEFLGVTDERIVEQAGRKFVPGAGAVWQSDQKERTVEATLTVGDYLKNFKRSSTGDAVASGLGSEIEEWIRENRAAILEKTRK